MKEAIESIDTRLGDIEAKLDNHLAHEFAEVQDKIEILGGMVTQQGLAIDENAQTAHDILMGQTGLNASLGAIFAKIGENGTDWRKPTGALAILIPLVVFILNILYEVII